MDNMVIGGSWATAKKEYVSPEYPFTGCESSGVGFRLLCLKKIKYSFKSLKGSSWFMLYRNGKTATNLALDTYYDVGCGFRLLKEAKQNEQER